MVKDTTFYDRLGVPPTATTDEIEQAGRRLSRKWHPDKCNEPEAEQRFKEIREALETLKDPERRAVYDELGTDRGPPDHPFGPFGSFMNMNRNATSHGEPPVVFEMECTLEQLAREEVVHFSYERKRVCIPCDGAGTTSASGATVCVKCRGVGYIARMVQLGPMMVQQSTAECPECGGRGKTVPFDLRCAACVGKTFTVETVHTSIQLKSHLSHGSKLKMTGQGHQLKRANGDLIVVLHELAHPQFKRREHNLYLTVHLNLMEALFGFTRCIPHVNGQKMRVRYVGKTDYQTERKVFGEGMTAEGDLILSFVFELPTVRTVEDLHALKYNCDDEEDEDAIDFPMLDVTHDSDNEQEQDDQKANEAPQCRQM